MQLIAIVRTVNTWAGKDLASLTCWLQTIAFYLRSQFNDSLVGKIETSNTFLFRQLLQFMASRGSLLTRRWGKRSMPTCGLAAACVVMAARRNGRQWLRR